LVSSEEYMVMNNVCGNEGQYSDGRSEYLAEDDTPVRVKREGRCQQEIGKKRAKEKGLRYGGGW
jgi:hypothetical protein